jgi:hypothetical protein
MTVYEAGHINGSRRRSTKDEMVERYQALYEIVRENQPTGVRFTYYAATAAGIVPKTQSGYVMVQRALLEMRRRNTIPWQWIVDSTRWMRKPTSYDSKEHAIASIAHFYRRSLWTEAETAVEVWCESESVAGVLYPVTEKWDVPLYPCKGQSSDTFAWEAAQSYKFDQRELVIFYVGDHDPHGYEIQTNLQRKLEEFSGRDDIEFERLACNAEDIEALRLSGSPPKKANYLDAVTGERIAWRGPAVEVEAIPPPTLRQWLDSVIEMEVDQERLRLLRVAEESEREALWLLAGRAS